MSKKSNRKALAELAERMTTLESSFVKLAIAVKHSTAAPKPENKSPAKAKPPTVAKKRPAPKDALPVSASIQKSPTTAKPVARTEAPAKKAAAPAKPAVKPTTKERAKPTTGKPVLTLKEALRYVLKHHREAKTGPVKGSQLYADIQTAGYKFGSSNRDNNLNYLHKQLRTDSAFKKIGDAGYVLA